MSSQAPELEDLVHREYQAGFVTDVESDTVPPGLDEDVIRLISHKKREPAFLLEWRLKSFRHWLTMSEPVWAHVKYNPIDYQAISYYSAPKSGSDGPKSLDEVDPKLLETYEKLGIPLAERARLAGVAVDAVFDSVSVATTFKDTLAEQGIIFCSFSEAVQDHPELIEQYLGTVVPHTDNYFAALNSAVFTDGSFCYIPKGVRCPMELSTYFRINAANTGQFERTLLVAEEGAYVSYLEGCTAPMRDENQLHAARRARARRHLQLRHQARRLPRRQLEDFLDPGGDRLGHHLEVSELYPARRRERR
jgi:Fe-S cluster assembly protein SufB